MNPRWKIEKFQQVRRITVALWDNDSPPTDQALDIIEAVLSGVSPATIGFEVIWIVDEEVWKWRIAMTMN